MKPITKRRSNRIAAATFAIAVLGLASSPALTAARVQTPQAVVETYYAKLNTVLQNATKLGYAGRYKTLHPAIKRSFDLAFISRVAVGPFWNKLDAKQRATLTIKMGELSAATYAARFKSYAGEKFEVLETKSTSRGDRLVLTRIVQSNDKKVAIDYRLRQSAVAAKNSKGKGKAERKEWRIIDVYLKGRISELAKWRAEFSSIVGREGYDGLIKAIDKKIAQLRAG